MRKPFSILLIFLVFLIAGVFGLAATSEAVKDKQVVLGSGGSGGAGGDDSGLPFENEAEAVADAVADAVSCVVEAFASILQDAKDLMATLLSLEETILSLISEAAQSVADLYLDYKTFLLDAMGRTVRDLGTKLLEAQGLFEDAKALSANQGSGSSAAGNEIGSGSTLSIQGEAVQGVSQDQRMEISSSANASVRQGPAPDDTVDADKMIEALESAMKRVQQMEREVFLVFKINLERTIDDAVNMIMVKVEAAVALAEEILVTPLRIYWSTLKQFFDNPCDFLNPIATAETVLTQVNDQLDGMVEAIAAIRNDVPGAFDDAETPIQLAETSAEAAGRIVDSMRALVNTKSRGSLNALNETISASRSMVRAVGIKYEMTSVMALGARPPAVDKSTSDAIRLTRKIQGKVRHMENRMQDSARASLAARQNLSSDLDRIFLNRSSKEAEAAKTTILNKIRIKHRNNNKLLSDAKSFLDREVALRVSTLSSKRQIEKESGAASKSLATASRNVAPPPLTRPTMTQQRTGSSAFALPRNSDSSPPPSMPRLSLAQPGKGTARDKLTGRKTVPPPSLRLTNPESPASSEKTSTTSRTEAVAPATRPAVSEVRSITPVRLPLVRGGTAQTITVTGSYLDRVTVQVVKGRRVVSDVTTSVRRISPTSFKVTLKALSASQAAGDDYYLRILSGRRVIKQTKFTVKIPAAQTPNRPMMRSIPRSIQR